MGSLTVSNESEPIRTISIDLWPCHIAVDAEAGCCSGGYHLPFDASHQPCPCETSLFASPAATQSTPNYYFGTKCAMLVEDRVCRPRPPVRRVLWQARDVSIDAAEEIVRAGRAFGLHELFAVRTLRLPTSESDNRASQVLPDQRPVCDSRVTAVTNSKQFRQAHFGFRYGTIAPEPPMTLVRRELAKLHDPQVSPRTN